METDARHQSSAGAEARLRPPAVGPRLRRLLLVLFALVALLSANAAYLGLITGIEWFTGRTYQNYFYQYMFLAHLALGLLLTPIFLVFGGLHLRAARNRKNRRAVRIGYILFATGVGALATGLLLLRVTGFDLKQPLARRVVYWLHVALPLVGMWLYWLHRMVGSRLRWRVGLGYGLLAGAVVLVMAGLHTQDPRKWNAIGPESGGRYFEPSLARTTTGDFIPAAALMNDAYCRECHADVHRQWSESVHRFSSFNNPPYLASVSETREVVLQRDGSLQASRWCAGCHDPVPFFSGAFDDPQFDMLNHATAQAGITCTVCHAITHVNSLRGNADYTIEEPLHYPFAYSDHPVLKWINHQLVKAKPDFHKKTFLKPFHKTAEFCSVCHKVHLPREVTHYKEFLRGQNHYDTFLLSGVAGSGAQSFYYPETAQANCNGCHMPLTPSDDFGAQRFAGADALSVHDHLFPGANTGMAWLRRRPATVAAHQKLLRGSARIDIFGLRENGKIDGRLLAPLGPKSPTLQPGRQYLVETVVRTLTVGHHLTQGTADSNQLWLDVTVTAGGEVIGRSGAVDAQRNNQVDPQAHFVNVFMVDRHGQRIDRRNAQDIFTPLYDHQIPPGGAQTVHYQLDLPDELEAPVTIDVRLRYRKFDQRYMDFVAQRTEAMGITIRGRQAGRPYRNDLPITTLAEARVTLPVSASSRTGPAPANSIPLWQRWNDYGIGLLNQGELRQAELAFARVEQLKRWDGPLNLARLYNREGRLGEAVAALQRAQGYSDQPGFPRWTWAWLSGDVHRQQGHLDKAIVNLTSVLEDRTEETRRRRFDFSRDYRVLNLLGQVQFDLGRQRARQERPDEAREAWLQAAESFHRTLKVDPENLDAHHGLQLTYTELGDRSAAEEHARQHRRYRIDDGARGAAAQKAALRYPQASQAAEAVLRYTLRRPVPEGPPPTDTGGASAPTSSPDPRRPPQPK